MLTYISRSYLYRSKMILFTFKVTCYANMCKYEIFLCLPASLDPLGGSVKWEEKVWCLNMKTIELKTPAISLYIVCSGHMDPCTFEVFRTLLEHLLIANTPLFSILCGITLQCFLFEVKFSI